MPPRIQNRVRSFPQAVGVRNEKVLFDSMGTVDSKIGSGSMAVQCVRLEDVLRDANPTFIKFDIEGAELDALTGGREVIARSRPILAVSVYHQHDHLWRVPLLIREFCPDYRFYLQPYGLDGWDLVCFAVPVERLANHRHYSVFQKRSGI